jgi:two-component system chemotaxis response regulator CheY
MKPDILIVDDSPVMRRFISRVLDATGLETGVRLEAANGQEGLEQLAKAHVDIVLADMNMPVMDGASMVRAMRGNPDWKAMPVLIVSTDRSEARAEEMQGLGVDGYVTKPFSPEELEEKILAAFVTAKERTAAEERAERAPETARVTTVLKQQVIAHPEDLTTNQAALVSQAVTEILETMCFLEAKPYTAMAEDWGDREQEASGPDGPPAYGAELRFDGGICGQLWLFTDESAARCLAANFLGEDEDEVLPRQLQQVLLELANMICGAILHEQEYELLFTLSSPVPAALPAGVPFAESHQAGPCEEAGRARTQGFRVGRGWLAVRYAEEVCAWRGNSAIA